jgi:hypothetical protein
MRKSRKNSPKVLCRYKMDGCSHCVSSQADWDNVVKQTESILNPDCVLLEVEAKMLDTFNLGNFKPNGFPTYAFFKNGKHVKNVEDRSFDGLMHFLHQNKFLKVNRKTKLKKSTRRRR